MYTRYRQIKFKRSISLYASNRIVNLFYGADTEHKANQYQSKSLIPHTKRFNFIYDSQNIIHNPYLKAYVNKKRAEIEKKAELVW